MLLTILAFTGLSFAVLYPLVFWIHCNDPLKDNFHRFHLGLSCFLGAIVLVILNSLAIPREVLVLTLLWETVLLIVTWQQWEKKTVNCWVTSLPAAVGLLALHRLQEAVLQLGIEGTLVNILAGLILAVSVYAMNLGHWYLNVHGLPIHHLKRVVILFWGLIAGRFLWDMVALFLLKVSVQGEQIVLYDFLQRMEGFLLWLAFLFGILLPLVTLYFVHGTLKVKSTQSATGILYVIVSAILIGEITFKYYLLNFKLLL